MYLNQKIQAMADLGLSVTNLNAADEEDNVYLEGKELMEFIRKDKIVKRNEHEAQVKERKMKIDQEKLDMISRALNVLEAQQGKLRQQKMKEATQRKKSVMPSSVAAATTVQFPTHRRRQQQPQLGFNTKAARFQTIGLHPKLDSVGCLKHFPNISPADYVPVLKTAKTGVVNWRNSLRTQVFSKTLGYQVPGLLEERKWRRTALGPAWYSLQGPLSPEEGGPTPGVAWSTGRRFPKPELHPIPGPGTHNIRPPTKGCSSTLPSFEWDATVDRCAYSKKSFHLPPNLYTVKAPYSIANRTHPDCKVSTRGPYDVFTGPRDDSTLYGFWRPSKFKGCKGWPFDVPSNEKYYNKHKGHFSKSLRFPKHPSTREELTDLARCFKDPNAPCAASYDQHFPNFARKPGKTYPFQCSRFHARPPPPFKVQPGPGRYDDDGKRIRYVNGHQSVFNSKSRRSEWMVPETFNSF